MRIRGSLLRMGMATTVLAMATSFLLLAAPATPSSAAAGYPPPTSTTTVPSLNTSCSATETLQSNGSLAYQVTCLFAPNATVTVTVSGNAYSTGKADSSGVFTENFVATGDPQITMNGGAAVTAAFGALTTFVATGPNSAGGTNTATTSVIIPAAAGAGATSGSTPLAFTGADLAAAIIGGLALLAMGTLMVVYARRRAGRRSSGFRPA